MENPWWLGGLGYPSRYREAKKRTYLSELKELYLQDTPRREVVLLGPRRVGKTFMIHHLIGEMISEEGIEAKRILYLQIDNPLLAGLSLMELLNYYTEVSGINWLTD